MVGDFVGAIVCVKSQENEKYCMNFSPFFDEKETKKKFILSLIVY